MTWIDRRDEKEAFVAHCSTALQVMLHWSKDRADEWASHTWDRQNDNPFFRHEHTSWYVSRMFLPPPFRDWATKPLLHLEGDIETILVAREHGECDWQQVRERIQQILSQHNARLPDSEAQADQEGWGE